ncbi:MAG: TIGR03617 family F420-dependent LLM class oxidoreductase [bacterium]|nr:TIGR03617 family F420-dependent LLM class oxidoreductase [bacterium]
MGMKVETVILGPDTDQYAGKGQPATNIAHITQIAQQMERLGFDGVTTPEAGHDPFLPIPLMAEHTRDIKLGTNVAIAFPRSPMVMAQIAWDLQQLSGGRFRLGIGSQVKAHVERRYATPWTGAPGPRMREYLECMRAMFATFQETKPTFYQGELYQFSLMNPFFNPGPIDHAPPEILIAAVNPYMAKLAGELCDGLRLHPIATFDFARAVVMPAIAQGASKAGRSAKKIDVVGAPFLCLARDEQGVRAAMEDQKQHIAFYASTPTYHSVLEHHGWMDTAHELHRMTREGKWTELAKCISDEMLEEWAIISTWDDFPAKCRARCEGIFDTVLLDLPPDARADEDFVRETVSALKNA